MSYHLKGTPPSQIHFFTSLLKVFSFRVNSDLSVIVSFVMILALRSAGKVLHSLDEKKLKLLHELFLKSGTVSDLLWLLAGLSLSLIFSEDPKFMMLYTKFFL